MSTETKTLPDKLSALIKVGIRDIKQCERDPQYEIHMYAWHEPAGNVCYVCLAGAVLAKSLGVSPDTYSCGMDLGDEVVRKTEALNEVRTGNVSGAICALTDCSNGEQFNRPITHYKSNPARFKSEMLQLAADLEAAGL